MSLRSVSEPVKPLFASRRFFPFESLLIPDHSNPRGASAWEPRNSGVMIPYMIPDHGVPRGHLAATAEGGDPSGRAS